MRLVYMGTPDFAVRPLESLIESQHEVSLVVTQPDRTKGRGKKVLPTPVKEKALEKGIEVIQPEVVKGNPELLEKLQSIDPDVIVVAAYGRILPKEILELPRYGCVNIHASLLPRWRGASPIQCAILSGDEETGITIMQMEEGLDTGDMLTQKAIKIEGMYLPELTNALSELGGDLIVETLSMLENDSVEPKPQNDEDSTYAGIVRREDGYVDFAIRTAKEIERMIRAYEPWPSAYCYLGDEMVKLKEAIPLACDEVKESADCPGVALRVDDSGLYISTRDGVIQITKLQMPGKKSMDIGSFLRGNTLERGTVFNKK